MQGISEELLVVFIFIFGLSLVLFFAAGIALRWLCRRGWKNKEAASTPIGICALAGGFTIVVCFLYALQVEPYWPEVTHFVLHSRKLPLGSRGFRIAQISDLHSDPQIRLEDRLPELLAAEKPDLIVFTGDCINNPEGLPVFQKFLRETCKIAPTFVVKGNWDAWYWNNLDLFKDSGATELNGNTCEIAVQDTPISITGFSVAPARNPSVDGGNQALVKGLDAVTKKTQFSIVLYHYPDLIDEVSKRNVDLYFAGHTHGGQVRLPLYGALITLSKFGKKYEAGLYHVPVDTTLYVNRGIGMEGGIAPRIRFLCRPEVTVIDVQPSVHWQN